MIKSILSESNGKLLYTTSIETELLEGEISIDGEPQGNYYNLTTGEWFNYTDEEQSQELINQAILIDNYYTNEISNLLSKHIQKKVIESIDIPQKVLEEVEMLKNKCREEIGNLGLTDFSFRRNNG